MIFFCLKSYLPPIGEKSLEGKAVDFEPCIIRQTLFNDKIFIFSNSVQVKKGDLNWFKVGFSKI
jgi:hypothetical protein